MNHGLTYKLYKPEKILSGFIDSFWMLTNASGADKKLVSLPDGRIDLIFYQAENKPLQAVLLGIETQANPTILAANTRICAISFKLLAAEYIFHQTVAELLDKAESLPGDFWGFTINDFDDFDHFCKKFSEKVSSLLPKEIDQRKQQLFELLYSSNGELTVQELSAKVYWSSRQINRYFNQQFGIPLKAYCNILRFRASFRHLSEGKLFPEQNFTDQNHFIKNIKKYTGVTPKILSENKDEAFFYLTILRDRHI